MTTKQRTESYQVCEFCGDDVIYGQDKIHFEGNGFLTLKFLPVDGGAFTDIELDDDKHYHLSCFIKLLKGLQ